MFVGFLHICSYFVDSPRQTCSLFILFHMFAAQLRKVKTLRIHRGGRAVCMGWLSVPACLLAGRLVSGMGCRVCQLGRASWVGCAGWIGLSADGDWDGWLAAGRCWLIKSAHCLTLEHVLVLSSDCVQEERVPNWIQIIS